ncbi:MAG: DUF1810 domain-containing protein [Rhodomicrobium sp.]
MSNGKQHDDGRQSPDPFDLERFVEAHRGTYERAVAELRQGAKQSHWMWYIFPQLRGLGRSPLAQKYGIASADEARAYAAHPVLGPRLIECTQLTLDANKASASEIFPYPDELKFHSCMTLFALVAPEPRVFTAALHKYCGGAPDPETLRLLVGG